MIEDFDYDIVELSKKQNSLNVGIKIGDVTARLNIVDFDSCDDSFINLDYEFEEGTPVNLKQFEQNLSRVVIAALEKFLKEDR